MSYCMRQVSSDFRIPAARKQSALEAIRDDLGESSSTLEETMRALAWPVSTDMIGNINTLQFAGNCLGDESHLFNVLAPFVTPGSFIEMKSNNAHWRWLFDGKICKEQVAKTVWEDSE